MMRLFVALLALSLSAWSLPVQAAAVVNSALVQQGLYKDSACRAYKPNKFYDVCSCLAKVEYPVIGAPDYAQGAETLNVYFAGLAKQNSCPGSKIAEGYDFKANKGKPAPLEHRYSFSVKYTGNTIVSLVMTNFEFVGGAHGQTGVLGIVGNLTTGKQYSVTELIAPAQFKAVNEYVYNYVYTKYAKKVLKKPKTATYLHKDKCIDCTLYLAQDGLHMLFQQYAIGPGSSGNLDVPLPKSFITNKEILNELAGK